MFSSIVIMSSAMENEDLDNGPLVRMEDVQPRDRNCDVSSSEVKSEPSEAYVVDQLDYDNGCVVDDDDSNIGSMISIQSEEVVGDEDSNDDTVNMDDVKPNVSSRPESWPTLEILPGGVIKNAEKYENDSSTNTNETENKDMMYACAKCSRSFKYLFCLVKHVRWHEKEAVKQKAPDLISFNGTMLQRYLASHTKKKGVTGKRMKIKVEKNIES